MPFDEVTGLFVQSDWSKVLPPILPGDCFSRSPSPEVYNSPQGGFKAPPIGQHQYATTQQNGTTQWTSINRPSSFNQQLFLQDPITTARHFQPGLHQSGKLQNDKPTGLTRLRQDKSTISVEVYGESDPPYGWCVYFGTESPYNRTGSLTPNGAFIDEACSECYVLVTALEFVKGKGQDGGLFAVENRAGRELSRLIVRTESPKDEIRSMGNCTIHRIHVALYDVATNPEDHNGRPSYHHKELLRLQHLCTEIEEQGVVVEFWGVDKGQNGSAREILRGIRKR